jgi:hypothetical protein
MEHSYLFAGILFHDDLEAEICSKLSSELGSIILESRTIPFDFSSYYDGEMGQGLLRKWVLFDARTEQDRIAHIKRKTIHIEQGLSVGGKRRANIDPGYVTLSKVVLATTKDCAHRIYLGDGIYAEITLIYYKGTWKPQTWTYRDYCTEAALEFFKKAREYILRRKG